MSTAALVCRSTPVVKWVTFTHYVIYRINNDALKTANVHVISRVCVTHVYVLHVCIVYTLHAYVQYTLSVQSVEPRVTAKITHSTVL
jgi:hypothetical protein